MTDTVAPLSQVYDVLVVGFGPSGAVAAATLGRLGHSVLVVDKAKDIYPKPRAIALDHEIMRHFDNMGIADPIAEHVAPFAVSEHFGAKGQLIRRITMVPEPYPLGYTPSMVFTQPPVEQVLRDHVAGLATIDIRLGLTVTDFAEGDDGVTVVLQPAEGGALAVQARYVIGCDGASSTLRQSTGITLQDLVFDEPWLVVDVQVHDDALSQLPQASAQFCNPERPTSYVIGPKNHRRWEIMLQPEEDPRVMEQPEQVWSLLSPWLKPSQGSLWRAAAYRFHALVAEEWRRGRLFIAGDAAHQQPPFFGQGMCQGVRDVTNLCWKLDLVLRGRAPEQLLDTYGEERKPHIIALTTLIKTVGQTICERDPAAAERRDAALLAEGGGTAHNITRQEIIPPLRAGMIASDPQVPARGTLSPQPQVLVDGTPCLLDTVTGAGWRILLDGRTAAAQLTLTLPPPLDTAAIVSLLPRETKTATAGTFMERDNVMAGWFARHGAVAVIIRPDHYIYGAARTPDEVQALLDEIAQRLALGAAAPSPLSLLA
jgi:3-(3-hydroxy-phenyl)propionate hydroxylase